MAIRLRNALVGRWKSGALLSVYPDADPAAPAGLNQENNFGFADRDSAGFGCPVGAHIRRANPRDSMFGDPAIP